MIELNNGRLSQKNIYINDGEGITFSVNVYPRKMGVYTLMAFLNGKTLCSKIVNGKAMIPYAFLDNAGTGELVLDIQRMSENHQTVFESIKCDHLIVQRSVNGGFEGLSYFHKLSNEINELEAYARREIDMQKAINDDFSSLIEKNDEACKGEIKALADKVGILNERLNRMTEILEEIRKQVYGG